MLAALVLCLAIIATASASLGAVPATAADEEELLHRKLLLLPASTGSSVFFSHHTDENCKLEPFAISTPKLPDGSVLQCSQARRL